MKKISLFFSIYILSYSISISQIVINEIMYAPSDASNEWFELYNTGNSNVSLQNWKWKDATSTIRTITAQSLIVPNGFIIICQDSLKLKNQFPNLTGIFIETTWSVLNNTGDNLILIDASNARKDSVSYQPSWGGNSGGFSLERINPLGPSNASTNWGTSRDMLHATPDKQNSLTPKAYDLILKSFNINPAFPSPGDTLNLEFEFKNIGLNPANNFSLNIYDDLNLDTILQSNELINSKFYQSLNQNDSLLYNYSVQITDTGYKQYIANINFPEDEDTLNNKLVNRVHVGSISAVGRTVINEIMYSPISPEPEWIEIYNSTQESVNIKNWKIADSSGQSNPVTLTTIERFINSNDYLVIAKNKEIIINHHEIDTNKLLILSSLPTLNNDKDKVILFNSNMTILDQVSYKSAWGGLNGKSLERKSPAEISNDSANWGTSIDCENSTPAKMNSVTNADSYSIGSLVINEIMYDPLTNQAEWIEFYNPTSFIIKIAGWNLKDLTNKYILADSCSLKINPGDYFVLAKDSGIYINFQYLLSPDINQKISLNKNLSLNNDGEALVLLDLFNNLIDSVYYSDSWNNPDLSDTKGISLERINYSFGSNDRSNWSSCAYPSGGTPGKQNSIYTKNLPATSTVSINPNPFSPDNDGFEDFTLIKFTLKSNFAQMRVKVYDIKGRLVRTLANNQITGSEGTIIFNGLGEDNQKLRIGIYILLIEAVDDRRGTVDIVKAPIVIASRL
ncbi:MAG: lamin tail domain-containing protein [bacterium]